MGDCKDCRHFNMGAPNASGPEPGEPDYRVGDCLIKMGEAVEIEIGCGTYCQGGWVATICVDATFGCKAFEPREPSA